MVYLGIELKSNEEIPQEFLGLKYFGTIIPYAFQQLTNVTTFVETIDKTLGDLLTGIENKDRLTQLSGIRFQTYPDRQTRVWYRLPGS